MAIKGFRGAPPASDTRPPVSLDESQRAVLALADADDAAAVVLGAAGSGKTTTLVELVADRVLGRGWDPAELLVLSATRSAATGLRDELSARLAVPTLGPLARTATSVAFQVLRDAAVREGVEAPSLLTGAEQDQVIAELLEGERQDGTDVDWPQHLDAEVRSLAGFRSELRDLIMRVEEYGLDAAGLAELGRRADRPEWVAAARFLTVYQQVLAFYRGPARDSAELVADAAAVVERGDDLGALATLRLLVLDDAQELTESVLSLVRALARRGVAVIAFGDPDLAVGGFRGARPELLGRLGAELGVGEIPTLRLAHVHRHPPALRGLVARVTGRIGAAGAGTQRAAASVREPTMPDTPGSARETTIDAVVAPSGSAEVGFVARTLRESRVLHGIDWSRLAVVVRSGRQVPALERGLAALEVPTRRAGAGTALRDERAPRALVLVLDVALGRVALDPPTAVRLLTGPFGGLDAVTLRRLRVALRQEDVAGGGDTPSDVLLVDALRAPDRLTTLDLRIARQAAALARSIAAAREEAAAGATIEELFWGIWSRSRLETEWYERALGSGIAAEEANRDLDAVVALFAAAKRFVERRPGDTPVVFLDAWADADVPEDTLAPRADADAVWVGTPASIVGRQFHTVIVAGVQEGVWPNPRLRGSLLGAQALVDVLAGRDITPEGERASVMNDELRLFAAAVSRASDRVVVTAVAGDEDLPSPLLRFIVGNAEPRAVEQRHPLSLRGLTGRLRRVATESTSAPQERAAAASALARLAAEGVPGASPDEWYGLAPWSTTEPLVDLTQEEAHVRVSPSRMETFETCELHWLIGELGGETGNTAANLGTIVHGVAEELGRDPDADISADAISSAIDARWGELHFDSRWESEMQRRWARELAERFSAYLQDFARNGGTVLEVEQDFEFEVGDAVLRGKIDRIERLADGTAVIVDLKTGRNEPISDDGVVDHAQLGAYQLAAASGAIEGMPADLPAAGAKLVVLSSGTQKKNYRDPSQPAFDAEALAEFRARVEQDAQRMAGSVFIAQIDSHCRDPWSYGNCAIHVVRAVSA